MHGQATADNSACISRRHHRDGGRHDERSPLPATVVRRTSRERGLAVYALESDQSLEADDAVMGDTRPRNDCKWKAKPFYRRTALLLRFLPIKDQRKDQRVEHRERVLA
jgi:hypothetical protein